MFRVVTVILLAGIGFSIYFFLSDQNATQNIETSASVASSSNVSSNSSTQRVNKGAEVSPSPVTASEQPSDPIELPTLTAKEKEQAQAHVDSVTAKPEIAISATDADHFVTAAQLITLPEIKTETTAAILPTTEVAPPKNLTTEKQVSETVKKQVEQPVEQQTKQTSQQTVKQQVTLASAPTDNAKSFGVTITSFKKKLESPQPLEQEKLTTVTEPSDVSTDVNTKVLTVVTPSGVDSTKIITPSIPPVKITTAANNQPSQPQENDTAVAATQDIPVKTTMQAEDKSAIISTLKKNIAEISDIKVEQLAELVSPKTQSAVTSVDTVKSPENTSLQSQKPTVITQAANTPSIVSGTQPNQQDNQSSSNSLSNHSDKQVETGAVEKLTVNQQSQKNLIQLRELLDETESDKKRIFYLHAVNPEDEQGIWGIIQKGLTKTFSKGINLKNSNGTLRALIPEDADEILSSKRSSFLGKLLDDKVLTTYVYNYEQGNIGKNPNFIRPGQQLIIVTFTEEELINVYQHFKQQPRN